jgi:outer membrane autotransporter protein
MSAQVDLSGAVSRESIGCRRGVLFVAVAAVISVSSVANAQIKEIGVAAVNEGRTNLIPLACGAASAAAEVLSSSEASNSIFLTQSTAFVSAPPNPKPDSQGAGVWVRGVGGEVQYNGSPTISTSSASIPGASLGCPSGFRQDFGGFQVGQDVAKLNLMGWNLHIGQTAGYIGANGHSTGGDGASIAPFTTATQIPFVGAYAAATNGGFFVDGLVRYNWFENSLNSSAIGLTDQKLDAHGVSVSGSLGYHWNVPNSTWFIEPSIAGIWSRTSIDPLNAIGAGSTVNATVQFKTIDSFIGRAGLRFGTTMQSGNLIYQPFVAVSAWHEFEGDVQANLSFLGSPVASITIPSIGTYGQYSLGVNAQIADTGWLGYARVDYRNGDHIEGWSGTGGIRYQFTPGPDGPPAGLYKAPVKAPVADRVPSWTGLYIGAFAGADYGSAKMGFPDAGFSSGPQVAGALAGGTLGYNYQIGPWVLGVEGDAGWTNARGSVACTGAFNLAQVILSGTGCADRADFIATAAARLGYAWGRALYYAKAGGAWTHETFTVTCNSLVPCVNQNGVPNLTQISVSDNRAGWTVGYGVEFALTPNWSAKGEVNYIDFGNKNLTAQDGTIINAGMRVTEGKIGVNYRFSP